MDSAPSSLSPREIDYFNADPEDIAIQWAHRWLDTEGWDDGHVTCRNGCGITWADAVSGKVSTCSALPEDTDEERLGWWRKTRGW